MKQIENRRAFLHAATGLMAGAATTVRAQDNKPPLRIIVPLPAGGVADTSVRFFADQWMAATKQTVVVDNRPGGSFVIGVQALLTAPPDGNTWLHLNNGMSATQASFQRYDLTKQLRPIGMMGNTPGTIFVNANSPYQSSKDLLDWIKANPGKLNYGAVLGGIEHLMTAAMLKRYGLAGTLVPFKGGPDAVTALAQNEIQMVLSALPLIVPFKGKIRPITIMTEERAQMTPDISTYKEQGLDSPPLSYWGAFAVHAATPAPIIDAHYKIAAEVLKVPTLMAKYAAQGMFASAAPGDIMAKIIADELKWMTPIASELNLKAG